MWGSFCTMDSSWLKHQLVPVTSALSSSCTPLSSHPGQVGACHHVSLMGTSWSAGSCREALWRAGPALTLFLCTGHPCSFGELWNVSPRTAPCVMGLKHFGPTAGLVSDFVDCPRNLVIAPSSYGLVRAQEESKRKETWERKAWFIPIPA